MSEPALRGLPVPSPEEAELVERARRGDHDAYAQLVREHEEIVFRVAYLIVRSAVDAAMAAFPAWKKTPGPERGRVLWRAADIARRQ